MTKVIKKDEVIKVDDKLNDQEKQALNILIQAVKIATTKGCFELDDAIVIGNAKNIVEGLLK